MARKVPELAVKDLSVSIAGRLVLDQVEMEVSPGEVVGIVGESGSGKTLTALAIMGLLPRGVMVTGGRILFGTQEFSYGAEESARAGTGWRNAGGAGMGMIFQNPRAALNPLGRVGEQLSLVYRLRRGYSREQAWNAALTLLESLRIGRPEDVMGQYPHELSGGMCQRVLIGMVMAASPQLLIADEPTTGLDVTTQAEILGLLRNLQQETGMSILFISHDLGVIANICDSIIVMYGGQIMEKGTLVAVFGRPSHPYTQHLFESVNAENWGTVDVAAPRASRYAGNASAGGCHFRDGCRYAIARCAEERPAMRMVSGAQGVACHVCAPDSRIPMIEKQ